MVTALFKKIIDSVQMQEVYIYPAPNPRDSLTVRREKQKLSSPALQRSNDKYAYQKGERLIACNFKPGDIWAVLTYDDEHLPQTRKAAIKNVAAFIKRLRVIRNSKTAPLLYLYNTEGNHYSDDPRQCGRYHHHIFINSTGHDLDDIREAWTVGAVLFKKFKIDRDHTFESAARYMCKEPREYVGDRLWSCSKNLRKPEMDRFAVYEDDIQLPEGAEIIEDEQCRTLYGNYRHIKYQMPGSMTRAPKAQRQPKRRRKTSKATKIVAHRRI